MRLLLGACRELAGELVRESHHRRVRGLDCIAFLTYRCTSNCKTCNIWQREGSGQGELTREQWLDLVPQLSAYGVRSFEIFGGDALLRKDVIFDLTRSLSGSGISTYFPTNGNLCDYETVQRLVEAGLGTVYLSIDDVEEGHDQVRGVAGTFVKVREALANFVRLRGASPKIVVCSTLSSLNFRSFPRLVEFLEQYPIDAVYPRPLGEFSPSNVEESSVDGAFPEPYFASSGGGSHLLKPGELEEMYRMIEAVKKRGSSLYINWRTYYSTTDATFLFGEYPLRECRVASTVVTINPNGDVVPCPFFRSYVLGNLREEPLEAIWGNERHRKFLAAQRQGRIAICRNCNTRTYYTSLPETVNYYAQRALERITSRRSQDCR